MHLACNLLSYPRGGLFRAVSRSIRDWLSGPCGMSDLGSGLGSLWINQSIYLYLIYRFPTNSRCIPEA